MLTTSTDSIQDSGNSAPSERLPYKNAVMRRIRSGFIGSPPFYNNALRIGKMKETGRLVEVYGCMNNQSEPGCDLPEVVYCVIDNDGRLGTTITKNTIFADPGFTFDTIFGPNKPSQLQLSYVSKRHILWSSFQQELSDSMNITSSPKKEILEQRGEFTFNSQTAQPRSASSSHAEPPNNRLPCGNTALASTDGATKSENPLQVFSFHIDADQGDHAISEKQLGDRASQHDHHSTQSMDSNDAPLLQVLTAKMMISQRINVLEAKEEELYGKIKILEEERDKISREQAKNWKEYKENKEQEEKIYSEMSPQKRDLFRMIRRSCTVEEEREEGRRKSGL